jgi:hypothetical protein
MNLLGASPDTSKVRWATFLSSAVARMAHCGSTALSPKPQSCVGQASVNLLPFSQSPALAVLSRRYSMTSMAYGRGGLCSRSDPAQGLAGLERPRPLWLVNAVYLGLGLLSAGRSVPRRLGTVESSGLLRMAWTRVRNSRWRLHQDFLSATYRPGWPDINFYNFQHMVPCLNLSQWCASKRLSHQVSLRPSSRRLKRAGAGRPPSVRSSDCSGAHLPEWLSEIPIPV